MGNRLSKIYTRTGDAGTTGLGDGSRVQKDHPRVEAMGAIDELNSFVGVLLANELPSETREPLSRIQHELFDLGGELCMPDLKLITQTHVDRIEHELDAMNANLPPLREFILPAGGTATAACHVARAVCRRAERRLNTLSRSEAVQPEALAYVNRLADYLFVLARVLSRLNGQQEVMWRSERTQ